MTITEALERFLVQLKADGRSPHTVEQYRRHVRLLAQWARDVGRRCQRIESLNHEAIAQFLAAPLANTWPDGKAKKPTSTNTLRSSLKMFFSHCAKAGYTKTDAGRLIRRAVCSSAPPVGLSDAEQKRLLSVLSKAHNSEDRRDAMLFRLMLSAGLRVGSVVGLDVADVNVDQREITLREMKGGRNDRVFINSEVAAQLRRYVGHRSSGPLFVKRGGGRITTRHVHRRFRRWLKAAEITRPASPHSLRHAFAMRLYRKTGDILLVKEAMGHKSVASTLIYATVDEARLRQVI